jgi:FlaA1/EpsC-like NDP-sugar epimerase/lipopolysaccharide/colanic/teichoic acid biosynthesis glycosyltransferase
MLKRFIDILLSLSGILLTLPFFPFIALLIKLDSKGSVFYLCERVGKDGKVFKMYKLRTMYNTPVSIGASVCPAGDPRVTPMGRFLRRTKLNEVPQLLNVLKGDMTLVGPRPEAPDLAALYPPYAKEIFTVKPGLVGPTQILGRNEDEWYPTGVDPQQYYLESILPKKLPIDLEYVRHASTRTDLRYLILGVKETLFKVLSWKLLLQNRSQLGMLGIDLALCLFSMALALLLRFEGWPPGAHAGNVLQLLSAGVLIRLPCFVSFGLYRTLVRYLSYADILNVCKGISAGNLLLIGWATFFPLYPFSRAVFLIDWLSLIFLMSAVRFALRLAWEWQVKARPLLLQRRVLIYGAGDTGSLAYRFLTGDKERGYEVVGFLDDDLAKRHRTLHGRKVLGNRFNIEAVAKLYQIQEILLAMPHAAPHDLRKITQACYKAGVRYRLFPIPHDGELPARLPAPWRDVALPPLLLTHTIALNQAAVRSLLEGKRVLLAGASGAFGLELCRQILRCSPHQLILVERYEPYLTARVSQLQHAFPAASVIPVLCPPSEPEVLRQVFSDYTPHVVFHNAMRKYLPFFPFQADSIVQANYLFTFALAKQAARAACDYFVLISSEAAARRGNLISDSLRAAEISLEQFFATQQTRLVTVRLCDVLENQGGTVARIKEQMAHREPVVLARSARYAFLSKQDAVHLILDALTQAATCPTAQGIFVYTPGTAIPLVEVASLLAMVEGMQLGVDIPVKFLDDVALDGEAPLAEQGNLVATANRHIRLLRSPPLLSSPAVTQALQALLHMQEQDLHRALWAQPTQTLLGAM